jgi:sec-independent protein translocase protein TatA
MGSLGPFEIIIIAVVLLLFFGAKRLPELAKGIGKSLKEFKKATQDVQDEIENSVKSDNSDRYIDHEGYDHPRRPEEQESNKKETRENNNSKEKQE